MSTYYQPRYQKKLSSVAREVGIDDINTLQVALKGSFKEYLFADSRQLIIVKKGLMTGHTLGASTYRMPYTNISGVHVDFHFMSGYFEVSAGGMQSSQKSYWDKGNSSPQEAPNTISLTRAEKDVFVTAANIINGLIATSTIPSSNSSVQSDPITELKRYKELADSGIITQTEFEAKKKQILGL